MLKLQQEEPAGRKWLWTVGCHFKPGLFPDENHRIWILHPNSGPPQRSFKISTLSQGKWWNRVSPIKSAIFPVFLPVFPHGYIYEIQDILPHYSETTLNHMAYSWTWSCREVLFVLENCIAMHWHASFHNLESYLLKCNLAAHNVFSGVWFGIV